MSKLRFALIGASVAALFATPINSSVEKVLCSTKTPLCYAWRSLDKILNETQKAAVIGLGLGIAIAGSSENKSKTELLNLTSNFRFWILDFGLGFFGSCPAPCGRNKSKIVNLKSPPPATLCPGSIQNRKSKIQNRLTPDEVATLCLAALCLILANTPQYKETTEKVASDVRANLAKGKASPSLSYLFKDLKSPGVLAIGAAEGNLTIDGRKTSNYFGHTDPGNSAHNRGFCSWQAGPVSSVQEADIKCLNRIRSRIGHVSSLFEDAGLDVSKHKSAAVAALDLWNQANPGVYQRFPSAYAAALKEGRKGQSALVHARVEAFRVNGVLSAGGLFKICRTSKFYIDRLPYTIDSEQWRYNCIKLDQLRRQKQIERVLSIN